MDLGFCDFKRKLGSIPESEPLYKLLKSRSIDLSKIKDKDERKYWQELKRLNEIPPIFISDEEQNRNLESIVKNNRMFGKRKMVNTETNETKYVNPSEFELYLEKGFTFSKRSYNRKRPA